MKHPFDKLPDQAELHRIRRALGRRPLAARKLRLQRLIAVLGAVGLAGGALGFAVHESAPQIDTRRWGGGVTASETPPVALGETVEVPRDPPRGGDFIIGVCCGAPPDLFGEKHEITTERPAGMDLSPITRGAAGSGAAADAAIVSALPDVEDLSHPTLRWFERHQSPAGSWRDDCPDTGCAAHPNQEHHEISATGLALLAFLGEGQTHRFGLFKRSVNKGLRWLREQQRPDGAIGFDTDADFENHAIATLALCEAFAVSRDFKLKKYAQRAVDFCLKSRGAVLDERDAVTTCWLLLALRAAKSGGLKVPADAFSEAARGSNQSGHPAAILGRILAGEKRSSPELARDARALNERRGLEELDPSEWYFGARALFLIGGAEWKTWHRAMSEALDGALRSGGCEDGSWDPTGDWCGARGRVYATAFSALSLDVYYCYSRLDINAR